MSGPLINRSLTTIRTELEFLHDSEVITQGLYNKLLESLPPKYQKDMAPWGVEKLDGSFAAPSAAPPSGPPPSSTDKLAEDFAKSSITNNVPAPSQPPRSFSAKPLGYCKALYDYSGAEADDIPLTKGDRIAVVEHLSEDWWKGYKKGGSPEKPGVFPSNYVSVISEQEFNVGTTSRAPVVPPQEEKSSYAPPQLYSPSPSYHQPPPQYGQPQQQIQPQPSYGGYAQFPPPSTGYYSPQPQQQTYAQPQAAVVEQQQPEQPSHLKKFGSKLGNAAIFGAGATIGGDIVNSIF
ncbi:SH3-domain-containing protein [Suhomyces tanzawaensis NRRL Y-17324]|uniref:SH3-domain-containing protein n=1 Tax=Suhomyces tanzawaensis NRRL Y-17324 TaxID=984487 RepID=A0A1E4SCF2_9ASCO|nr:SH3-domain-containing protein [Suhomyces tanzawaensis NRRL Y-17324]ODV77082.1 SH3-domain-containing protein [Suhomyces tanzawaensis NRRL Y-17324]